MAKERGFHVTFSGEDGARTPPERLVPYVEAGFANGADRFRLAETVASLTPWQMQGQIANLTAIDGAEIEIHSHNMLGMAVANSLAALPGRGPLDLGHRRWHRRTRRQRTAGRAAADPARRLRRHPVRPVAT